MTLAQTQCELSAALHDDAANGQLPARQFSPLKTAYELVRSGMVECRCSLPVTDPQTARASGQMCFAARRRVVSLADASRNALASSRFHSRIHWHFFLKGIGAFTPPGSFFRGFFADASNPFVLSPQNVGIVYGFPGSNRRTRAAEMIGGDGRH
jgi:hypothetical protein